MSHGPDAQTDPIDHQQQENDFFRLFYNSSDPAYNGDIGASLRLIGQPLQGAASVVMGGILSAFDSALTILNEEFDDPADSMVSATTAGDDEECEFTVESSQELGESSCENNRDGGAKNNNASSNSRVLVCCRKIAYAKAVNERITSADERCSKLQPEHDFGGASKLSLRDDDCISLQDATITNSTLLHVDDSEHFAENPREKEMMTAEKELSSSHGTQSPGVNGGGTNSSQNSCNGVPILPAQKANKRLEEDDDSAYCIVQSDQETNDGWLVVTNN